MEHLDRGGIHFSVARNVFSRAPETPPPETADVYDGLPTEEIRSELERVRKSRTVGSSERLIQFLNFVVEAALNGEHLKETTIGVYVFGRSPDYDPKVDTIVRSQAWRLRSKLRKYYASEGANAHIVVDIPTGHYVPVFHVREAVGA